MALTAEFLFAWWNLIFIVPFLLALLYLGLYAISGVTLGEANADADVEADADLDAAGDIEGEVDVVNEANLDADTDAEANISDAHADHHIGESATGQSHVPFYLSAMSWLGLGRVPLSLLILALLISWGVTGFLINAIAYPSLEHRSLIPGLPLAAAFVGSLLFTSCFSRFMGRWIPMSETYARRRHELLGLVGEAIYSIDHDFGMASVRDDRGVLFQIPCRVFREAPPIPKGSRVRLVAYNGRQRVFHVTQDTSADAKN